MWASISCLRAKNLLIASGLFLLPLISYGLDYFWIGNGGSWSDLNHWATSSGGLINHLQVPTPDDNVFFDENSFTESGQTVAIYVGNAVCRDMTWTGAKFSPQFMGTVNLNFRVYGSLTLIGAMNWNLSGDLQMESTASGNAIKTYGQIIRRISFRGIGGGWELMDELTISEGIAFYAGTFITNGHNVNCRYFSTGASSFPTAIHLGNSVVTCNSPGYGDVLNFSNPNLSLHAGTSLFKLFGNTLGRFVRINGAPPQNIAFHDIEITNTQPFCQPNSDFSMEVSINTTIRKLTLSGKNVHLKDPGYTHKAKIVIDTLLIGGECTKSFDSSYNFTINEIICWENSSLLLNVNHLDTIANIGFAGPNCIINGDNAKFHRVILEGDSYLNGNNQYDSLTFAPGFSYEIGSSNTQTIVNCFTANGLCSGNIFLKASSKGSKADIRVLAGSSEYQHMILRDIDASTGNVLTANQSIDLGNNSGWNINTVTSRNLFWVGGTGNWADSVHWSTTSGGTGGACIPTPIDNVYFNGQSFLTPGHTVTIDVSNALCHDMIWTDLTGYNPVFSGDPDRNLRVFGSLTFHSEMSMAFQGQTLFEADDVGNTITSAGKVFNNNIYFFGFGQWTLLDDFLTAGSFVFISGSVNTNNKNVYCKTLYSDYQSMRELTLGSTVFTCTSPARDYNLRIRTDNFIVHAGTSTLILTGYNTNGYPMKIYGDDSLRFYNVENINHNTCSDTSYTCWDIRSKVVMNKLTLRENQFRLIKKGTYNVVKIIIDTLLIQGNCEKIFDSVYNLKISEVICTENSVLSLHANRLDTIKNILFNGFHCNIYGDYPEFNKVILNRSSHLFGNSIFDSLTFAAGCSYHLSSADTQTVINHFASIGSCTGNIMIRATSTGTQACLMKTTGNVVADYVILQDQHAAGGAFFEALNSCDMGNNSGWAISPGLSNTLFWVGGSGDWNDPSHWALTSGGAAGVCLPSPFNNVIFDQNSFDDNSQTVNVNTEHAFCKNMTWINPEGQPEFVGNSMGNLHIYGSLALSNKMDWNYLGKTLFEATTPGNAILLAGRGFMADVCFQGSAAGGWLLEDPFSTSGAFVLNSGILQTNNHPVNCKAFISDNTLPRSLILGSTILTCDAGVSADECLIIRSDNLTLNAGASTIRTIGRNDIDHAIKLHGNTPLILYDIDVINTGSQVTFLDFSAKSNINKLTVEAFQCVLGSKKTTPTARFSIDTLILKPQFGNGFFNIDAYNQYGAKCQMKIGEIFSHQNTNLTIAKDINDTIDNIQFNGELCTLGGSGTKFKKVVLNGNAIINGSNTFDSLILSPGRYYTLQSNSTQYINNWFSALGNGCFPITIHSSFNGVQSTIHQSNGTVICGYVELKDQKATGGATFYAGKYSTNVSNNTGWIFQDGPGYVYGLGNDTSFCEGETFVISTAHFYGGISWLWQDGSVLQNYPATQPGTYWVKVTYSNTCFYSDTIELTMKPLPTASANGNSPLCAGSTLYLHGAGGSGYAWTGPDNFSSTLQNPTLTNVIPNQSGNYVLRVIENGCYSPPQSVPVEISPVSPVSVEVDVSANPVCEGTSVLFSAVPHGGGTSPEFQWYINNSATSSAPTFNYVPEDGDEVSVTLTSSLLCQTGGPASSEITTMVVHPNVEAGITISTSSDTVCSGTEVSFSSVTLNGGPNPIYQWKVNNVAQPFANNPLFSFIPENGDIVECLLSSSLICLTENPVVSNPVPMAVYPSVPVSVLIEASANPFCKNSPVTISALPQNGGINPVYQWYLNNNPVGGNLSTLSITPGQGDNIFCQMLSDRPCVTNNPSVSNTISMSEAPSPIVSFTACNIVQPALNTRPFTLRGGLPLGGMYSGPGVDPVTGIFHPMAAGLGNKIIAYSYQNIYHCLHSQNITIDVLADTPFTCGDNFTDPRDNQSYPTFTSPSGKCWMASNLNYGNQINGNQPQTDNCTPEKYCLLNNPANCDSYGAVYQWDEVMNYEVEPGRQDLCPSGWHIPSKTEWDNLCSDYEGNGMAAGHLKDTLTTQGFHGLLNGLFYLNHIWAALVPPNHGAMFWTSTRNNSDPTKAESRGLHCTTLSISTYQSSRYNAFPVRCVKN